MRIGKVLLLISFICLCPHKFFAYGEQILEGSSSPMPMEQSSDVTHGTMEMGDKEVMIPHPFFSHEGLPDEVGSYSLRISGLATHEKSGTKGDFAYHLETGLIDRLGFHSIILCPKCVQVIQKHR